jgi:hypothetical protein
VIPTATAGPSSKSRATHSHRHRAAPMIAPRITTRQLNRALLARQLLLRRAELTAVQGIEHLVGMQAQSPTAPYVGLWSRLEAFAFDDVADLIRRHQVVRLSLMRNTIHLVTTADAHWLRPLLAPMMTRSFASSVYAKALTDLDVAPVVAAGRQAVDEEPRTFAELASLLSPLWPGRDPKSLAQVIRAYVPLVQVPPRGIWGEGGLGRHTSLEAWVGPSKKATASMDDLVLRYLAAFGPASVADVQAWSGLTRLREVIEHLRGNLTTFRDENDVALFDLPDAPRPDPDTPAPVRFVAEFDNIVLSHAERSRIVSEQDRGPLFRANGIIPGSVLVDGFVAAVWKMHRSPTAATVTVKPFRPLSKRHGQSVTAEGRRLLAAVAGPSAALDVIIGAD